MTFLIDTFPVNWFVQKIPNATFYIYETCKTRIYPHYDGKLHNRATPCQSFQREELGEERREYFLAKLKRRNARTGREREWVVNERL